MVEIAPGEFTRLLAATRAGDGPAWSSLMQLIYADLRRLARRHVAGGNEGHTLGTTGLVHECYLRLAGAARGNAENRGHFLNLASRVMRQVLCDYARERLAAKRGGGLRREEMEKIDVEEHAEAEHLIQLDEVLGQLERENARWARIVECRYFAGLTEEETAEAVGLPLRSTQREWQAARAWLEARLA